MQVEQKIINILVISRLILELICNETGYVYFHRTEIKVYEKIDSVYYLTIVTIIEFH